MSEIRKMIKETNKYVDLICNNPEEAKANCDEYLEDVIKLRDEVKHYLEECSTEFSKWSNKSVSVWMSDDKDIISKTKRKVFLSLIRHHLGSISLNYSHAEILTKNIDVVEGRLQQYSNLLGCNRRT